MDKIQTDYTDKIQEAYEKVLEQTPYSGTHINHSSSVSHIKKVYGNTYKVVQSPSTGSWYVMGKNAGDWVPVTTPFANKEMANQFKSWLDDSTSDTQQMVGTTTGGKRIRDNKDGTEPAASTSKLTEACAKKKKKMTEEDDKKGAKYQAFFKKMAKKMGIDPEKIEDLPADKKKKFFDAVDKGWKADKETDVDESTMLNELTIPSITDMKIKLGQSGTSFTASSDGFDDRYDGHFKGSFMGIGQTPDKALSDLMKNIYKHYSKSPQMGKGHRIR